MPDHSSLKSYSLNRASKGNEAHKNRTHAQNRGY